MHANLMTSAHPAVSLPSADAITHPVIREAVQGHVDAMQRVIEGHTIAGKLRAGHNLDDFTPEQIAEAVALSRDGNIVQAEARERLMAALAEHRGEWAEDTTKRVAKARTAAVKALAAAKAALSEYELSAGILAMLSTGSPELRWKPPAEHFEIGAVRQPLQAALDTLSARAEQ